MLERWNPLLRIVCLALAGVIVFQVSRLAFNRDALARSNIDAPLPEKKSSETDTNTAAGKPVALPREVQARIDEIKKSQLLAPDIKPPPMALLGIAGQDVFLRGPNGQTGLLRKGEELDGVKLIKIGTNRVVVEQDKQQKELTIFSGFGSETLLPKKKDHEPPR